MMNKTDEITPQELQRLLHNGMGRAILFLLKQDLTQYRDIILHACLHNYAYDAQIDGTRAEYMYPLIKASGEEDFYRQEILRNLLEENDEDAVEQLLDFGVLFACDGDERFREAIRKKIKRGDTAHITGEEQIIELDGIDGLIFILDLMGRGLMRMSEFDDELIKSAEIVSSVDEVRSALQKAVVGNPNIAAALANIKEYSPDWTAKEIVRRREQSIDRGCDIRQQQYADISEKTTWEEVRDDPRCRISYFRWPSIAADAELEKAAREIILEQDPKRLSKLLFIFYRRPFPLVPDILMRLVDHEDDMVATRALSALENISQPSVRDLFFRIHKNHRWSHRAIGLLRNNYRTGDDAIITDLLANETDTEKLHSMCMDTRDVFEQNTISDALTLLLMFYEKTPCSHCRNQCVEDILQIGQLPDWMLEECQYDAYPETRELAANLKAKIERNSLPNS